MSSNKCVTPALNTVASLKESIAENKLKYLIPNYVDMHGIPKTKIVPIDHMENMLASSKFLIGAALDGVTQNMSDNEVASVPDPDSFLLVPWRDDCAWFSSDLWLERKPFEAVVSIFLNVL